MTSDSAHRLIRYRGRSRHLHLIGLIIILAFGPVAAAQDGSFAGIISGITCRAQIVEVGADKTHDVTLGDNRNRPVASGDRLRCTSDGQILVRQGLTSKVITKNDGWVTVRPSPILNSIVQYSDLAGTRQGGEQPIYSPPSEGATRASSITIRWNPWPGIGSVSIAIWPKETREKLCCEGLLDGTRGTLESNDLRRVLIPYRSRTENDRKFILNITGSALRDYIVVFTVLSSAEESELDDELSIWERRDPLLRHIGRAYVFSNYRLFTEAAEEYEAALRLAPTSPYLLGRLIEAEQDTGNLEKRKEFEKRLAALSSR